MAQTQRSLNSNFRPSSFGASTSSSGQSPFLLSRINEKKTELENLKQLRDLSGGLATEMQALEDKIKTLSSGTEAVATVLSNWHNVMRAIHMASAHVAAPANTTDEAAPVATLPQTLVRIPAEDAPEKNELSNQADEQT